MYPMLLEDMALPAKESPFDWHFSSPFPFSRAREVRDLASQWCDLKNEVEKAD